MISLIKELYCALNAKQLRQIYLMQFVMIISAFSEIATVTAIGIFIFSVGNPEAIKDSDYFVYLIDFLPYYTRNDAVFVVVLLVVLVILISTLLSILTLWLVTKFGYSFGVSIENQLFGYFLNKDWLFHTKNSSSSLINKITNECTRVAGGIVIPLLTMNSKIVMIVAMIVTMVLYDPIVAISMTLFFIAIYTLIYFFIRKRLKLNGVIIAESDTNRFKVMSSGFGGIKDILVLRRQNKFSKKFDKHGKAKADSYIVNGVLGSVPKNVIEFAAFLVIIVIVLYSSNKQQIDLNVLFPILAMYGIAGLKLLPAFQSVYQSAAQIKGHIAAFNSIKHHISAAKNARNIKADNHTKSNISGDIILKNISYSYPDSAFKSLSNIDMKIVENTTVGIVGHSGSGKSTLIDILLGLMPGTEGDFYVGDDLINKKKLPLWQKKIGFVPQSIYLMDASIKENIAFGLQSREIKEDKINESIVTAHLEDFVSTLPFGVDSMVGDRGVQLSGGQKQRIGIARAIYNNPKVLIMDEATSALDGITEMNISKAISDVSGTMTIIMIAHRLNTVKDCDVIYFMDHGKIVDHGTYEELVKTNPDFRLLSERS